MSNNLTHEHAEQGPQVATRGPEDANERLSLRSATFGGGEVPQRVLLTPWGEVESSSGPFIVDEEAAKLAVEAFRAHATDLPVDYEHHTLGGAYAAPDGQAVAAGWVKELTAEPGVGLVALIDWTEPARRQLAARQYRYLSPVALIRRRDRKLVAIHSAALTNKPAIVGMPAIVNRATDMPGVMEVALTALRAELKLADDADAEAVLAAARERLAGLREELTAQQVEGRLAEAVRGGKLAEAQRDWARTLLRRDEALFEEWLRTAPAVVACGATRPPRGADGADRQATRAARARAEFALHPLLAELTSEEAYVADSLRRHDDTRTAARS
ncbi:MAG TPA: phage protease [Phycisphaerae bacterium]|nr:phage protease [Phycisphaerae bacterium]HNU43788.1 phage protease [Phycisphaerae bacterium]